MPLELTTFQWATLAGAIALVVLPRLTSLWKSAGGLAGLFRRGPSAPDVHAKVDAYRTLATDLSPELARDVWASIQSPLPPTPTQEVSRATEVH